MASRLCSSRGKKIAFTWDCLTSSLIKHTHTHRGIALTEHVAQHPPLANNDTQAQRGKWVNFLKVQLYGMGGDEERIWCLFQQHVRDMENSLILLELFSMNILAEGITTYPAGSLAHSPHPHASSGRLHPTQPHSHTAADPAPLGFWMLDPYSHHQPWLFSRPTSSTPLECSFLSSSSFGSTATRLT